MELRNNKQNSIVFEIENLLNKMSNQVNFLIRKNLLITQLDIDLLMDNTRKLYDTLCSIKCNMNASSIPMEVEGFFNQQPTEKIQEKEEVFEPQKSVVDNNEDFFEPQKSIIEEEKEETFEPEETIIEDEEEHFEPEETIIDDDEETFDPQETIIEEEEETFVPEETITEEEEEEYFEPQETIIEEEKEEDSGIRVYTRTRDESYTLSDKLEQAEDISLAARLQKKPVADLASAIGINDKFLLLNELFDGSMDKFNKSIRALNSFSTLFGAKTYMSELQIEFQWNCESEAYKKLNDLVERRFMSIHNS